MKLVCISDDHHKRYYLDLPPGDILIHAGDFTYKGEKIEKLLVLDWLEHVSSKYQDVIVIAGNHDIGMTKEWLDMCGELPENVHILQDSGVTINGINFYGSPYTPRFGNWGFGETEDQLMKRFKHIPKKTNVLITHGPAYSILDKNKFNECCGSQALYQKIKQLPNLKYHIFGHIHEQGGKQEVIENVTFCNVSVLNEYYKLQNKPTVIEI